MSCHVSLVPQMSCKRPNLILGSTNSTQGILRLVVTGNVSVVYRLDKKITVVGPVQVYYHIYLIHVSFN